MCSLAASSVKGHPQAYRFWLFICAATPSFFNVFPEYISLTGIRDAVFSGGRLPQESFFTARRQGQVTRLYSSSRASSMVLPIDCVRLTLWSSSLRTYVKTFPCAPHTVASRIQDGIDMLLLETLYDKV